jgi:hypothetical protein
VIRTNETQGALKTEQRNLAPLGRAELHHEHASAAASEHDHHQLIRQWIWRDYLNITLGMWLAASPVTFGYRSAATTWSDIVCGLLIVGFASAALQPRYDLMRWGVCAVGIWLLFAPLVFWTPDASAYANDTLVGGLVIAFSVLIPMMPGRSHHQAMMLPGPEIPPGWSYNPSSWIQRGPIIAAILSPAT